MIHSFTQKYESLCRKLITPCGVVENGTALDNERIFGSHKALWDTGTSITTIAKELAVAVGTPTGDTISVNTINGVRDKKVYLIDLMLPGGIAIPNLTVYEGDLQGIDILIGMDIISMGSLAVTNKSNKTVLSFKIPSDKVIDFTQNGVAWWSRILNRR